ncbi:dihydrolipoyllysine-residue acetyltransferase [Baekduia soli]|uniref:Acetyltransferase component of pyruvate dehydrogenase complex n=1 Tax=Baekduia soli TaxID=496014 RepID=A0A5B8U2T4_9ACTN|nr:dihydrolipoyllysine-residue acetyltransferase [Baekduia soli]QEC47369.1 dihydrolipoyllysine-residue acetyltransferase [Baekduia soli]
MKQVTVPDIGEFSDVEVVEVHVAAGDEVAENDPLVTLETDKATMDVPAPFGGVVEAVLLKVGDRASQGTPVVALAAAGGDAPEQDAVQASPPTAAGAPAEAAQADTVRSAVSAEASAQPAPEPPAPAAPTPSGTADEVYASPSVRRLARELGVDLHAVSGSGRKGRIVPEDVRAFADGGAPAAAAQGASDMGLDLLPWPTVDFEKFGEVERVPLSRIRKISAANLARNWVYIPHVTHNDEADVTELEAFRKQLNAEQSDVKVTMVALLLKASAATLKAFPDMNSSLDGDDLVRKHYYHLGFAADTPNGLVVPVVRDVDRKGILEVAAELTELSGKARAGKLGPAEMAGGTFTISSLGGIGGTSFTPIVNAPQVGILGAVRTATKPVWDGTQFVPRLMLPLSLSYDHRVIDGAAAARFTAHLSGVLSDLRRILL